MASRVPMAQKVLGDIHLSRDVHSLLFSSQVLSRLTYSVHVWSSISRATYRPMNAVYMKGARAIVEHQRFDAHSGATDSQVRREIGWPSLACVISRERLLVFFSLCGMRLGSFFLYWQSGKALLSCLGLCCSWMAFDDFKRIAVEGWTGLVIAPWLRRGCFILSSSGLMLWSKSSRS